METSRCVAVLSDVHGNAVALASVLAELDAVSPDLVLFGGDLTWGPLPQETLALARELTTRTIFVRGNAERALSELAGARERGAVEAATLRERWLLDRHDDEERAFPRASSRAPWSRSTGWGRRASATGRRAATRS